MRTTSSRLLVLGLFALLPACTEKPANDDGQAVAAEVKAEGETAGAEEKLPEAISSNREGSVVSVPLGGKTDMPFVFCPAGTFTMGSPDSEEGRSSDEDQVQVTLSKGFWLAKTEVTQAQWEAVMGGNPSKFKGPDLPVENVSWDDARSFIRKANDSGVLPQGWKLSLPTEAQWEYACRAGETGPYSGGSIGEVAWYSTNSGGKTHPVGGKRPNAWGLHDMHGNVWEWCGDWYHGTLPGGTDPTGPAVGVNRVFRGGSWINVASYCRAASRVWLYSDYRDHLLGFRPALVPSE